MTNGADERASVGLGSGAATGSSGLGRAEGGGVSGVEGRGSSEEESRDSVGLGGGAAGEDGSAKRRFFTREGIYGGRKPALSLIRQSSRADLSTGFESPNLGGCSKCKIIRSCVGSGGCDANCEVFVHG